MIKTHRKNTKLLKDKHSKFIEQFEIVRKAYNLGVEKICSIADRYNREIGTHKNALGIAYNLENLFELLHLTVAHGDLTYCFADDSYISGLFFGYWDFKKLDTVQRLLRSSEIIEIMTEDLIYCTDAYDISTGLPHSLNYKAIKEGIDRARDNYEKFALTLQHNLLRHVEATQEAIVPIIEILKSQAFTHREKRYLCNAYKHLASKFHDLKIPSIKEILEEIESYEPDERVYYAFDVSKWLRNPNTGSLVMEEGY